MDAMTLRRVWRDDSQVASCELWQVFAPEHHAGGTAIVEAMPAAPLLFLQRLSEGEHGPRPDWLQ
jgi:hypothetical protein